MQDGTSCEETQEVLALLKLLAIGNHEVQTGRTRPLAEASRSLRALLQP